MIQRVLDNAEKVDFDKYFSQKIYSLTEKGSAFLQEHDDYIRLNKHGNWGIDVQEYEAKRRPGYSFYDTVWRILNERISPNANWGRNEYFFMYQLLAEEGRRKAALGQLLRVLYLDISGMDFLYDIRLFQNGEETLRQIQDLLTSTSGLAPGVIGPIATYKDVYDDKMIAELYKWKIPVQLCSQELFLSLVHSVLDDTYDENVYASKLKAEYRQKLSQMKHK